MDVSKLFQNRDQLRYEKSRTLIYISKKLADDSAFPFKPGEALWARIDGKRLLIERSAGRKK